MANETARRLRRDMTVDERKLWNELRDLRRIGFHFRRQAPIGRYIVDFVCFSRRLVIEVDGVQHHSDEGRRHDAIRDAFLKAEGFKVLRFSNGDVTNTPEGVMMEILRELGVGYVFPSPLWGGVGVGASCLHPTGYPRQARTVRIARWLSRRATFGSLASTSRWIRSKSAASRATMRKW